MSGDSVGASAPQEPAAASIGPDLLAIIFAHLPPSDLARADAVCTTWRRVCATHPQLWQAHAASAVTAQQAQLRGEVSQEGPSAQASAPAPSPFTVAPPADGTWKDVYLQHEVSLRWRTGRAVVRSLDGHAARVTACSAWGTLAASASDDQTVRLWDVEAGACRAVLRHAAPVNDVVQLGPALTAAAAGREAWLWRGSRCLRKLAWPPGRAQQEVKQLAAVEGDTWLAGLAGARQGDARGALVPAARQVAVWDLYSGGLAHLLQPPPPGSGALVSCLAAAEPLGRQVLLCGGTDGVVRVVDMAAPGVAAEVDVAATLPRPPGVASKSVTALCATQPHSPAPWELLASDAGSLKRYDSRMLAGCSSGRHRPPLLWEVRAAVAPTSSSLCVGTYGSDVALLGVESTYGRTFSLAMYAQQPGSQLGWPARTVVGARPGQSGPHAHQARRTTSDSLSGASLRGQPAGASADSSNGVPAAAGCASPLACAGGRLVQGLRDGGLAVWQFAL